jgi:hypothetical protein
MKYFIVIILLFLSFRLTAQNKDTTNISSLQVPSSPGFQLLDVSPSNIERPTSPKEFALSILNTSNSGSAIPKNFAMESSPYWFIRHDHESIDKYLNVGSRYKWSGIGRKLAISLTSVYNDSTSGSLLKNTNYISAGFRTNILTMRGPKANNDITSHLHQMASRQSAIGFQVMNDASNHHQADTIEAHLKSDSLYQRLLTEEKNLLILPSLLQFDIAGAYSVAFVDNTYSENRFNRAAAWATVTLTPLTSTTGGNLAILGVARIMDDNALTDTAKNIFTQTTAVDLGASLNYTLHNLSVSFEHLERKYQNNSALNSQRTVLIIQYKVSDNLYVTGTYGKNFGNIKNLFALLGLNFGFGSSSLVTRQSK